MAYRKTLAAATAVLLLVACDQSTTEPGQTTQVAIQSALMGGGALFQDGGAQPAILGHLVHAAIGRIAHDSGSDAAHAAGDRLKALVATAQAARQAGDTVAARAAMEAVHHAEAEIVVQAFGADAVNRAIAFADSRMQLLNDRIAKAASDSVEHPRLVALATSLNQILSEAKASAAAGDNVSALLGATKVVEALHIVAEHRSMGPRGSLPLDTTRVRRTP